jgi:hypothetical protein
MNCRLLLSVSLLVALFAQRGVADEQAQGVEFFESKIRPVLVKHCYDCHSAESGAAEGDLELDTRKSIRAGGARGPAVVPGDPGKSLLLTALSHADTDLRMPPKEPRLPAAVIADVKKWIEMGAPDPRDGTASAPWPGIEAGRNHWAYQPPVEPALPAVKNEGWTRRPIDFFILAELERNELKPSADAAPEVLLRRLHFDLTGLPPSPAATARFLSACQGRGVDAALADEVDDLLASPQFGERWGRHWLDVARFAESSGNEANITFPYAFRYRDYVIDAVSADIPIDRFLTEQLAGDLLPYDSPAERARLLTATGFLAVGPKNLDEGNGFQFLADLIDEQIDAVSRAVTASTIACARCHHHKFDPFSMQDYYALAGVFASTKTHFGTSVSPSNRVGGEVLELPRLDDQLILHKGIPKKRVDQLQADLAELQAEKAAMDAALQARLAGQEPEKEFTLTDAIRNFWRTGSVVGQLQKVDDEGKPLPLAMGVLERDEPIDVPLLERGDINRAGDPVPRGFPQVIELSAPATSAGNTGDSTPPTWEIPPDASGRLQLAQWLTHPRHPLTGRVFVNRIWRHLFGAGLVPTVDNFGTTGEPPSHPELLDYLAVQFVNDGWSLKRLVREIVLSRTYRQASTFHPQAFEQDPENRLLWRAVKRRLDAEAIRDAMLAASGELDLERPPGSLVARVIGDRPVSLVGLDKNVPADLDGAVHRSVYLPILRDRLPEALDLFDFAETSLVTGDREVTNVPTQALYLLNSPFVLARAEGLAARLSREANSNEERIRLAFGICFGRTPEQAELARALHFLENAQVEPAGEEVETDFALVSFCQSLLATAEFRNLD